jgi:hypothetical protein
VTGARSDHGMQAQIPVLKNEQEIGNMESEDKYTKKQKINKLKT